MKREPYEVFTCECGEVCEMIPHERTAVLAPITLFSYDNGNIEFVGDEARTYRVVPKDERERTPKPRHLNHFTNCPARGKFGPRRA